MKYRGFRSKNPFYSSIVLIILGGLGPAIQLLLLPVYLQYLSVEDFATQSLMGVVGMFIGIVGTLRIDAAMITYFFDYKDPAALRDYLRQLFSFCHVMGLLTWLTCLVFGPTIFKWLFKSDSIHFYPIGFLCVSIAVLGLFQSCYLVYLKNSRKLAELAMYVGLMVVISLVAQIALLVFFDLGLLGIFLGILLSQLVTWLWMIWNNHDLLTFRLEASVLKPSLYYSIGLIVYALADWMLIRGDRLVLEWWTDLKTVGPYAMIVTLGAIMHIVLDGVMNGIRPFMFENFKSRTKDKNQFNNQLVRLYIAAALITCSFIYLIGNNLSLLTDKSAYLDMQKYFFLFCLVLWTRALLKLFYQQLIYTKHARSMSIIGFMGVVVLMISSAYFIPSYSISGLLLSLLLSFLIMSLIIYIIGQIKYPLKMEWRALFLAPLMCFSIMFLCGEMYASSYAFLTLMQFGLVMGVVYTLLLRDMEIRSIYGEEI